MNLSDEVLDDLESDWNREIKVTSETRVKWFIDNEVRQKTPFPENTFLTVVLDGISLER